MSIKQNIAFLFKCSLTMISPKLNTLILYRVKFRRNLDLKNPHTLNEKILWLKFNDYWNNPLIKQCADKFKVRDYIRQKGCGEILNDLLAVYDSVDEVEWDKLPSSFVIKLNIGSGYNLIVPNKKELNICEAKKRIAKWMKSKYYLEYSEMQYKNVKPYILVEKYLKPKKGLFPDDYKFYSFDGDVPYVMVCTDRKDGGKHPRYWYYNDKWELQMLSEDAIKDGQNTFIPKPDGIEKAFEYARTLSKGFPFVRVDLYVIDGKVYFGELTFTPSGGLDNGRLPKTDEILGEYVNRP